ncbi:hypothetical protein KEJ15_03200 [Candidatus Bathyarchaeota archaeon]|nr:hypothetical protein [Candidatus Bathyarchaeota archaeon]
MFANIGFVALFINYVVLLGFSIFALWKILNYNFGMFVINASYMPLTHGFPWRISILWGLGHLALAYITINGFLKKRSLRHRIIISSIGVGIPLILLFFGISWLSSETMLVWLYFFGELHILPVATYTIILVKQKDLPDAAEITQLSKSLYCFASRAHAEYKGSRQGGFLGYEGKK